MKNILFIILALLTHYLHSNIIPQSSIKIQELDDLEASIDFCMQEKNYLCADSCYFKIICILKRNPDLKYKLPFILYQRALLYQDFIYKKDFLNYKKANDIFEIIIQNHPQFPYYKSVLENSIFNYALLENYNEEYKLIIKYLKEINSKHKVYISEAIFIALNYNYSPQKIKILESFLKNLKHNNDNLDLYYKMGLIHYQQQNFKTANIYFQKVLDISFDSILDKRLTNTIAYCWSLLYTSKQIQEKFYKIKFNLPKNKLFGNQIIKKQLYSKLISIFNKVLYYQNYLYPYVLLEKIDLLNNYGETIYNQEFQKDNIQLDAIINRKNILLDAANLYQKSRQEYLLAENLIDEFLPKYQHFYNKNIQKNDSLKKYFYNKKTNLRSNIDSCYLYEKKYLTICRKQSELRNINITSIINTHRQNIKEKIQKSYYFEIKSLIKIIKEYQKIKSEYPSSNSDHYYEKLYLTEKAIMPIFPKIKKKYQEISSYNNKLNKYSPWVDSCKHYLNETHIMLKNNYLDIINTAINSYSNYCKYILRYINNKNKNIDNKSIYEMKEILFYINNAYICLSEYILLNLNKDEIDTYLKNLKDTFIQLNHNLDKINNYLKNNNNEIFFDINDHILENREQLKYLWYKIYQKIYDNIYQIDLKENLLEQMKNINAELVYKDYQLPTEKIKFHNKWHRIKSINKQLLSNTNQLLLSKIKGNNYNLYLMNIPIKKHLAKCNLIISDNHEFALLVNNELTIDHNLLHPNSINNKRSYNITKFLEFGENKVILITKSETFIPMNIDLTFFK